MISDILSDAADEIRRYLTDPVFAPCYENDLRPEIVGLLIRMAALRHVLDTVPTGDMIAAYKSALVEAEKCALDLPDDDETEVKVDA